MQQKELAARLGVSQSTLAGWEKSTWPRHGRLEQIADALGTTVAKLVAA